MIAIKEWHCVLADELDSTERKFNSQGFLVNGFQKSRTQRAMNANGSSNNLLDYLHIP